MKDDKVLVAVVESLGAAHPYKVGGLAYYNGGVHEILSIDGNFCKLGGLLDDCLISSLQAYEGKYKLGTKVWGAGTGREYKILGYKGGQYFISGNERTITGEDLKEGQFWSECMIGCGCRQVNLDSITDIAPKFSDKVVYNDNVEKISDKYFGVGDNGGHCWRYCINSNYIDESELNHVSDSKFQIGDVIHYGGKECKIIGIGNGKYYIEREGGTKLRERANFDLIDYKLGKGESGSIFRNIASLDKMAGDVLVGDRVWYIFNGKLKSGIVSCYDANTGLMIGSNLAYSWSVMRTAPKFEVGDFVLKGGVKCRIDGLNIDDGKYNYKLNNEWAAESELSESAQKLVLGDCVYLAWNKLRLVGYNDDYYTFASEDGSGKKLKDGPANLRPTVKVDNFDESLNYLFGVMNMNYEFSSTPPKFRDRVVYNGAICKINTVKFEGGIWKYDISGDHNVPGRTTYVEEKELSKVFDSKFQIGDSLMVDGLSRKIIGHDGLNYYYEAKDGILISSYPSAVEAGNVETGKKCKCRSVEILDGRIGDIKIGETVWYLNGGEFYCNKVLGYSDCGLIIRDLGTITASNVLREKPKFLDKDFALIDGKQVKIKHLIDKGREFCITPWTDVLASEAEVWDDYPGKFALGSLVFVGSESFRIVGLEEGGDYVIEQLDGGGGELNVAKNLPKYQHERFDARDYSEGLYKVCSGDKLSLYKMKYALGSYVTYNGGTYRVLAWNGSVNEYYLESPVGGASIKVFKEMTHKLNDVDNLVAFIIGDKKLSKGTKFKIGDSVLMGYRCEVVTDIATIDGKDYFIVNNDGIKRSDYAYEKYEYPGKFALGSKVWYNGSEFKVCGLDDNKNYLLIYNGVGDSESGERCERRAAKFLIDGFDWNRKYYVCSEDKLSLEKPREYDGKFKLGEEIVVGAHTFKVLGYCSSYKTYILSGLGGGLYLNRFKEGAYGDHLKPNFILDGITDDYMKCTWANESAMRRVCKYPSGNEVKVGDYVIYGNTAWRIEKIGEQIEIKSLSGLWKSVNFRDVGEYSGKYKIGECVYYVIDDSGEEKWIGAKWLKANPPKYKDYAIYKGKIIAISADTPCDKVEYQYLIDGKWIHEDELTELVGVTVWYENRDGLSSSKILSNNGAILKLDNNREMEYSFVSVVAPKFIVGDFVLVDGKKAAIDAAFIQSGKCCYKVFDKVYDADQLEKYEYTGKFALGGMVWLNGIEYKVVGWDGSKGYVLYSDESGYKLDFSSVKYKLDGFDLSKKCCFGLESELSLEAPKEKEYDGKFKLGEDVNVGGYEYKIVGYCSNGIYILNSLDGRDQGIRNLEEYSLGNVSPSTIPTFKLHEFDKKPCVWAYEARFKRIYPKDAKFKLGEEVTIGRGANKHKILGYDPAAQNYLLSTSGYDITGYFLSTARDRYPFILEGARNDQLCFGMNEKHIGSEKKLYPEDAKFQLGEMVWANGPVPAKHKILGYNPKNCTYLLDSNGIFDINHFKTRGYFVPDDYINRQVITCSVDLLSNICPKDDGAKRSDNAHEYPTVKEDITDACYRVAAKQLVDLIRGIILTQCSGGVKELIETAEIRSVIGLIVGYTLSNMNDVRAQRLAKEFRVAGMMILEESVVDLVIKLMRGSTEEEEEEEIVILEESVRLTESL